MPDRLSAPPTHFAAFTKEGRMVMVTPIREVAQHYANMETWRKHSNGFGFVEEVITVERGVYRRKGVAHV